MSKVKLSVLVVVSLVVLASGCSTSKPNKELCEPDLITPAVCEEFCAAFYVALYVARHKINKCGETKELNGNEETKQ